MQEMVTNILFSYAEYHSCLNVQLLGGKIPIQVLIRQGIAPCFLSANKKGPESALPPENKICPNLITFLSSWTQSSHLSMHADTHRLLHSVAKASPM